MVVIHEGLVSMLKKEMNENAISYGKLAFCLCIVHQKDLRKICEVGSCFGGYSLH